MSGEIHADPATARSIERNRAMWDERVPLHEVSDFYDVAGFRAGAEALTDFQIAEVGDVQGKSLLHLQCHIGLETLAFARRGAAVTGLDFSEPAVRSARGLAADIGAADAEFVAADVYAAPEALGGRRFDIVYTGVGALCWLPDIPRWAGVVARLLEPGGACYLAEFHPFGDALDGETGTTVTFDYFDEDGEVIDMSGSYADFDAATAHNTSVQWRHRVGSVVTALAAEGLRLEFLHEHPTTLFQRFDALERHGDRFHYPTGVPRAPLMYSLRARA
ncbi:methyltransferase family protein [Murinocardiopsis flavida]|uniref:Methyltransferase family protein n=1 Tax=Murinocardiopsis flavida TaxID=645275 RepID=A0A2P8CXJ4_9ACTN|nr:class I SAM-dependent methyltransferase [Murinocardiopsis flavida]PSK89669.1 methyltransferase family protein [Murinocardiopsis flavida]